jgi:ATP-binding cassette subfamily F protein uup
MQNPNFLILDEPTNDLDIMTLNVLEEYLQAFAGCVVIVSHDRFFMDKIVDHLFVFEGDGKITDFPGNYTVYRNKVEEDLEKEKSKEQAKARVETKTASAKEKPANQVKQKLSFNEKREFEQLEKEIPELESQKLQLENLLNSGELAHDKLYEKSLELDKIKTLLDEKEFRWLELSEIGN